MANSMLPNEVATSYIRDTYASGSSDNHAFVNLSSLENIAEAMGDGWTAENVSSGSNAIHFIDIGGNNDTLKSGKSLPMLKNTTLYPNLGICFPCGVSWLDHQQITFADVINISTGECLSRQLLTNVNVDISSLDVYSFNSTTKAIYGATERVEERSAIIFTQKGIITTENMSAESYFSYRVILPDGSASNTTIPTPISGASRTHFEPIYSESNPSIVFDGIYLMTRGSSLIYQIVNYSGVTYDIFGNNRVDWSDTAMPFFVVSSEILE